MYSSSYATLCYYMFTQSRRHVSLTISVLWFFAVLCHGSDIPCKFVAAKSSDKKNRALSLVTNVLLIHYSGKHCPMPSIRHTVPGTPFQSSIHLRASQLFLQKFLGLHNMVYQLSVHMSWLNIQL